MSSILDLHECPDDNIDAIASDIIDSLGEAYVHPTEAVPALTRALIVAVLAATDSDPENIDFELDHVVASIDRIVTSDDLMDRLNSMLASYRRTLSEGEPIDSGSEETI